MNDLALTISRGAPEEPGLDWSALRAEGLRLLEAQAGAEWSDFNAHDPGVTLLELLCYALTELSHRAGLAIEDLLAAPDGTLAASGRTLRRPWRILPTEPVTAADQRRLLIDRIDGLGNAWLEPRPAEPGLYDVRLYAAPALPGVVDREERPNPRLLRRAARLLVRHRALCEDIGSIRLLRPVRTVIEADVEIEPAASVEAVVAEIVYRLGRSVAPEPRRRSLAAQREGGRAWPEILAGPLPRGGFVPSRELGPCRTRIAPDEIAAEIAAAAGVRAVRAVSLSAEGREPRPDGAVSLGRDECFALDAGLDWSAPPIAISLAGSRRAADPQEVRRLLAARWEGHRRRFDVRAELRRALPAPAGRHRDLAGYTPIADHLPAIYGVGPGGLPGTASAERRGQARQLLGYLALFDRQMVDFLDRLVQLPALIAGEPVEADAFRRPLAEAVPRLSPLLEEGGPDAESLYGRAVLPPDQQSRLLDFLLGLHGEAPSVPRRPGRGPAAALEHEIAVKRELLRRLAVAGRGRGLDYRARRSRRGIAGAELRARILLGNTILKGDARPRLTLVEHVLLRPREPGAGAAGYAPLTVTAVVHLPGAAGRDRPWRAQASAMLREVVPAHVALGTLFLDAPEWRRFRRLHRMWRVALRAHEAEGADWLSERLAVMIDGWIDGDRTGGAE